MSANRTPWFPGDVRPHRIGWYEVRCEHGVYEPGDRRFWEGDSWRFSYGDYSEIRTGRLNACDMWRGLAENPASTALDRMAENAAELGLGY